MARKEKILIVAKTYPSPSMKYKEIVCTGGVLEDGSFIRLYPINYRDQPYWRRFKKYQWIEVEIEKHDRDPRPESYRPVSRITPLGPPITTDRNWAERKKYVLVKGTSIMCDLRSMSQDECSFSIIRPRVVNDVKVESDKRQWGARVEATLKQYNLFGPDRRPLEKIPYKFKYIYKCENQSCPGHAQSIIDWEVGQLYRRLRDQYDSEEMAVAKVKEKLLNDICSPANDTHFYVGTILRYGSWIIAGAFYPKKLG